MDLANFMDPIASMTYWHLLLIAGANLVGWVLKERTPLPNETIPFALFVGGATVGQFTSVDTWVNAGLLAGGAGAITAELGKFIHARVNGKAKAGGLPVLLALLVAVPASADTWREMELRGDLQVVEVELPFFGGKGRVKAAPALNLGLGWRQTDEGELLADPTADGLKPMGIYAGVGFAIDDSFGFNWLQLTGGVTYEEVFSAGLGLWVGNATETMEDGTTHVVDGLDFRLKLPVIGVGLQGDPE